MDIESLRRQLEYVEETGWLRWKKTGKIAGCVDSRGYILVRVDGKLELAHRIIWAIKTGEQPPKVIDHDDQNKSNNRWKNLVATSHAGNGYNRKQSKGCYQTSFGKWVAAIHSQYGKIHIGTFDTEEQAKAAYDKRKAEFLISERK